MKSNNAQGPQSVKIPYAREELEEIINILLEGPKYAKKKEKVFAYVDTIEKKITKINQYQTMKNPEKFYPNISASLSEIKNTANSIYELTQHCDESLSNTLNRLILGWIKPLEEALKNSKLSPEIAFKTKRLYAQQSLVSRRIDLRVRLMQHLNDVKKLFSRKGTPAPRCCISYACPSEERKEEEYWVQPFLYVLYDHLAAAGIRVVMDIRDSAPGNSIIAFMGQYHEGNYVILTGTKSLLDKHYAERAHAVQTELSIITNRFEQDHEQFGQSRIYPMLINGTISTAYPEIFDKYHTVHDARESDYLKMLKNLTDWIYAFSLKSEPPLEERYTILWQECFSLFSSLPDDILMIEEEIARDYHRPRHIEDLKQNWRLRRKNEEYGSCSSASKVGHSLTYMYDRVEEETDVRGESSCSSTDDGPRIKVSKS